MKSSKRDLERFLSSWATSSESVQGIDLIARRAALINEAADRLRGRDLADFLNRIIEGGEFNTYAMPVIGASRTLFSGADESLQLELAKDWIAQIPNPGIRQRLASTMGFSYFGPNVSAVLDGLTDIKTKQSFLDAYCSTMATHSPCEAFRVYQTNLPKGGDYSGLAVIAANMTTEFGEFLAMLPTDERSLVSKARDQALKSWGSRNPLEAANYVRENSGTIQPSYIRSVISTWMESDPNAAITWVQKEEDPVYRENSFRGIVEAWKGTESAKAWELVLNESGIGAAKDDLLKKIHAEWIKTDPNAAEAARVRYQATLDN